MTIGIDARMLGSAPGIGRYIARLSEELFALDRENQYAVFLGEPAYSAYAPPRPGVRKVYAPERWYSVGEQVTLPVRFFRERLDLLFVPQFNVPLLRTCPVVVTIHDVTQLYTPGPLQVRSQFRRTAFRFVFSRAVRNARAVIAVSHYTKREILKNFSVPESKIRVIYEGAGVGQGSMEKESEVRFAIPRARYLLAVGVWRPHKNFDGLLEAFAVLRNDSAFHDLLLVLVGEEDPRYPEVRERIRALELADAVLTPGVLSDTDLDACYRHAALVVVPSRYEGFGFVGLEALTRGVPVAASYAAAIPEILGDAALYFNPESVDDMTNAIRRGLTDQKERQRVLKIAPAVLLRYSWRRAAEETHHLFREAMHPL